MLALYLPLVTPNLQWKQLSDMHTSDEAHTFVDCLIGALEEALNLSNGNACQREVHMKSLPQAHVHNRSSQIHGSSNLLGRRSKHQASVLKMCVPQPPPQEQPGVLKIDTAP